MRCPFLVRGLPTLAAALSILFASAPILRAGGEAKKLPVPDKAAQAKSLELIDDIFKEDYRAATTAEAKSQLAQLLLQQGRESRDDASNRFVLYREAMTLAAGGGDADLALQAIQEMERAFLIDASSLKAHSLDIVAQNVPTKEAARELYDLLQPMIAEAVEADSYPAAAKLAEVAETAARKSKVIALVTASMKRQEEIAALHKSFSRQQAFLDRLKKDPADAEANRELGRYFALNKGRWERGLQYLARANDPLLSELATLDLKQPEQAKEQLSLADRYWEAADREKDPAQLHLQRRAMTWYEKALPNLAGLNRTKALRRIDATSARLAGTTAGGPVGPLGEIKKFEGHTREIKDVAFSPDNRFGASAGTDLSVRVWSLASGKEEHLLRGHTKEVWGVAFHPTQRVVLSASWDATVRVWDLADGKEIRRFTHPKDINSVAVNREGTQVLVGCDDGSVYLWNYSSGEEIKRIPGHTNFVYGVAFAPDGRHVASGSLDRSARVYDLNSGALVRSFDGHPDAVLFVAFSADGKYLFTAGDNHVRQWEIATGKEFRRYEGHKGRVLGLAVSTNGRRLLSGGDDQTLRVWDTATGKLLETFKGHTDSVSAVTFSRDGARALSGSLDRTVRLWGVPR